MFTVLFTYLLLYYSIDKIRISRYFLNATNILKWHFSAKPEPCPATLPPPVLKQLLQPERGAAMRLWQFSGSLVRGTGWVVTNARSRASLVVHWLRISLPMQGTGFEPCSGKIPHAAEQLSPCATTTEPVL